MKTPDYANLLLRLFVDLCAIGLFNALVALRRPRRGLFMVFTAFNVGIFAVLSVISVRHVGPAVGFGLFALLSIVRLRSEPFSNQELSYFFCAIVLGLINGLRVAETGYLVLLDGVVLVTLFFVDHPALYRRTARQDVRLDGLFSDPSALRTELERRLGVEVLEVAVRSTDYVRDTTDVTVRYLEPAT